MMTQKELKALYTEELKKAWDDEKMVKFCSKATAYVVEHNGKFYGIEKPEIKKNFCYSYGYCGKSDSEQEDAADKLAARARTDKDYFISENLKKINCKIIELQEILENMKLNWVKGNYPQKMIGTGRQYIGQPKDCKLYYHNCINTYNNTRNVEICEDTELVGKLIKGYEQVKADFIKRLNAYLKRYGLSKVKSWSFLSD